MGNQLSFSAVRADSPAEDFGDEVEAPPSPPSSSSPSKAAAPPPQEPQAHAEEATLESLSPEELDELKNELVSEIVSKIAGEEGEKLQDFFEPELLTAPYDPRFPNRNQARHCFVRFNEYHKCVYERGEDEARCQFYQRAYQALCPSDWLENWQELREKGLWAGKY